MDDRPTTSDIEKALQAKQIVGIAPDSAVTFSDSASPQLVYQHIEGTVHTLLDAIQKRAAYVQGISHHGADEQDGSYNAGIIKTLAEAVAALSAWPQFNPMNAHEQYAKLAEYEVNRALDKARGEGRIP